MQFNIEGLDLGISTRPRKKRKLTKKKSVGSGKLDLDSLLSKRRKASRKDSSREPKIKKSAEAPKLTFSAHIWDPNDYPFYEMIEKDLDLTTFATPIPALELQRHYLFMELKNKLTYKAKKYLNKGDDEEISNEVFDKWYMRQLKYKTSDDVLFPVSNLPDVLLKQDLIDYGLSTVQSDEILEYLMFRVKRNSQQLKQMQIKNKRLTVHIEDEKVTLKLGKKIPVVLHRSHYEKLQCLFHFQKPNSSLDEFQNALYCLLLRHVTVCDGGFQSALQEEVFIVLKEEFGVYMECFASPLNCRYRRFCSQWADTDKVFGSVGSFFQFHPTEGSFEANPPFENTFIHRMAEHMDDLLTNQNEKPLQFIVFIPNWKQTSGWNFLKKKAKRHIIIEQQDHGYCEGPQHRRETRFRIASFDTAIFFLQNRLATKKWPVNAAKIQRMKQAFRPKQSGEASWLKEGNSIVDLPTNLET